MTVLLEQADVRNTKVIRPGNLRFAPDNVSWWAIANLTREIIDLHARCAAKGAAQRAREAA